MFTTTTYERPDYHISSFMYVEKQNFFSCQIMCVATIEVQSSTLFCIPNNSLVVDGKYIQCFSAHENAFYE